MVNKTVRDTYNKIARLEIQGASDIAVSALIALKTTEDMAELRKAIKLLKKARSTEPMLRNAMKYLLYRVNAGDTVKEAADTFIQMKKDAIKKISEVGARRIENGFTVMTHCHSSAVMAIFKKAKDDGKKFRVIASETRPLYQGRRTARELASHGIKVTSIVDGAIRAYVNDVDIAFVGADAITADAHIVNKVGTSILALCANEARTPFGVATELFKFDPETTKGDVEPIEIRDPDEIWKTSIKGIKVENRAFDFTPPEYIDFMITEQGIINAFNVSFVVNQTYRWMI